MYTYMAVRRSVTLRGRKLQSKGNPQRDLLRTRKSLRQQPKSLVPTFLLLLERRREMTTTGTRGILYACIYDTYSC